MKMKRKEESVYLENIRRRRRRKVINRKGERVRRIFKKKN